ncbi:MAG: DUF1385 domain-containing protein [Chloroflexota bacterium]|nr:DUF1385 domain-containing protein [Chloroflexota bacterium]
MNKKTHSYGGQAVIEGVMIRGRHYMSVAVRRPDGGISLMKDQIGSVFTGKARNIILIRGIIALGETLILGMKALTYSANVAAESEGEEISKSSMVGMIAISVLITVCLFFILPVFASKPFEGVFGSDIFSNMIEAVIRLGMFVGYIFLIGRMDDIKRVFMYHGAEHMIVHVRENGQELSIENARKFPTAHPRCGTAFLLVVMVVAVIVLVLMPRDPFWWLLLSRVVFIPLIAAISYEVIRWSGKNSGKSWVRIVTGPSLALQSLTTSSPDDDQIEVAIAAMELAIEADST